MAYEQIRTEVKTDVGFLALARPQRKNALSIKMRQEMVDALRIWQEDRALRAVVLRGDGEGFCAGNDREETLSADPDIRKGVYESSKALYRTLAYFPKPTVAAVHGTALGAGLELVSMCDVRIAAEGAFFGHPDVKFGAHPVPTPLRLLVGEGWARDLCFTGRRVYAADALRMGLVTYVVSPDDLLAFAETTARRVIEAPPETLRAIKSMFINAPGSLLEECFVREHDEPYRVAYGLGGAAEKTVV